MMVRLRWLRLLFSYGFFAVMTVLTIHYKTVVYIAYQAYGQFQILYSATTFDNYAIKNQLSPKQKENIKLIEQIKSYSVDSFAYQPTQNFTKIYNQKEMPLLWVITACKPYNFEAFEWSFPLIGKVSYKGFFKKELAQKEYNHLVCQGYDVSLKTVTAWSTLGWFNDPITSSMLNRTKGALCNLLFHELFHATYYAPGKVDFNENIASFIAHQATLKFLKNDTAALKEYELAYCDNELFSRFMLRQTAYLKNYYSNIAYNRSKQVLKLKQILAIADSVEKLRLENKALYQTRRKEILQCKNACFIDFQQYDSMQDSLEVVFNKIYKGDIKKMVQDLKQNRIYY